MDPGAYPEVQNDYSIIMQTLLHRDQVILEKRDELKINRIIK